MCRLTPARPGASEAMNASTGSRTSARYRSLFSLNHSRLLCRRSSARKAKSSREMRAIALDRAVQPAVDVDALARDVARLGRAEERGQERHVGRVAEIAERDVAGEFDLALGRRVQALIDLLAVDPPGRQAIDRDPVPPHLARASLRPAVDTRLRRHR